MEEKSKVLIIGATGRLGYHLVTFSLQYGHPTFILIRDSSSTDPDRAQKLDFLSTAGAIPLKGSLEDEKSLMETKFIPSEFGVDPDKIQISDLDHQFYSPKAEIRRLVEAEGIPYTNICCNFLMSYLLPWLAQPGLKTPPRDKDIDIAACTISAIDDPRTLNKTLYLRPPGNVYSMDDLVAIWENKIDKKLEKIYVPEEELLKKIKVELQRARDPYPDSMEMIFIYSVFVKGDHTYFDIKSSGADGTQLYPDLKYTTVSEHLDTLL
ncbi:hypothetical protein CRYUN_Cryun06bG0039700 [Craigia yunnanensis]